MTQITGPGAPSAPTMTGGENEEHPEPPAIGAPPEPVYTVLRGEEGKVTPGAVVYTGPSQAKALEFFDKTDPGEGFVQMLADGEVVEAKRAETLAAVAPAAEPLPGQQASAFDEKPFTSKRPMIDDEEADKIKVQFSGTWELDPMLADDVAFFNRMVLGKSIDLRVEAEVSDRNAKMSRNEESGEETVTGVIKLKVIHAYRLVAEEL